MKASVIVAKCNKCGKTFGMRIQEIDGDWYRTWAFKISDKSAKDEGYIDNKVTGSLNMVNTYPGCPHCGAMSFYQCGACEGINCYDPVEAPEIVTCAFCGSTGALKEVDQFDVSGNAF